MRTEATVATSDKPAGSPPATLRWREPALTGGNEDDRIDVPIGIGNFLAEFDRLRVKCVKVTSAPAPMPPAVT